MTPPGRLLRTATALLLILLQCVFPFAHGLLHVHGHAHGGCACDGGTGQDDEPRAAAAEDCLLCDLQRAQPKADLPPPAPAHQHERSCSVRHAAPVPPCPRTPPATCRPRGPPQPS